MYFEKVKQDADSIVEASFALKNAMAEKEKLMSAKKVSKDEIAKINEKISLMKKSIAALLADINANLGKQEAEING